MKLTDLFIADIDREAPLTRRALEKVPEGKPDWKPHPKSMPLGYLSSLVAMMPSWLTMEIEQDEFDLKPASGVPSKFAQKLETAAALVKCDGRRLRRRAQGAAGHDRRSPHEAVAAESRRQGRRRRRRGT